MGFSCENEDGKDKCCFDDKKETHAVWTSRVVKMKQPKTVTLYNLNYYAWRPQFAPNLRGNHLIEYMERTTNLVNPFCEQ